MIAADTSTWVAYLQGSTGEDVDLLTSGIRERRVLMPPAVLTELLSDPELDTDTTETLLEIPLIATEEDYWRRVGELRARVLARKRKARLGDALIAQSCCDRGIPLVTRDRDFRAFAEAAELRLVL